MTPESETGWTETVLGNGDTLGERIERLDLDADEMCSPDALRHRLDL